MPALIAPAAPPVFTTQQQPVETHMVPQTVTVPSIQHGFQPLLAPSVVTPRDNDGTQSPLPLHMPSSALCLVPNSVSSDGCKSHSCTMFMVVSSMISLVEVLIQSFSLSSFLIGTSDSSPTPNNIKPRASGMRLNKFVRRLHDMLQSEQKSGIVEWRRGLLVLHSTDSFAKTILPKYFNTRNFKTFRRQLNYYGFVHVRSFSTTGSTTTALWVNRDLAKNGTANISSVLQLKRVEPCESAKTAEGRRVRKELAVSTVEDDIGVSAKSLQLEQIRAMALRSTTTMDDHHHAVVPRNDIPLVVHCPTPLLPRAVTTTPTTEPDNESAANLLLMLSKAEY